jgi:hypothetical protein
VKCKLPGCEETTGYARELVPGGDGTLVPFAAGTREYRVITWLRGHASVTALDAPSP